MPATWSTNWTPDGRKFVGGQGRSFAAHDSEGRAGFVKELKNQRDRRARGRFRKEVSAYEILADHPSLPALLEDNAHNWRDQTAPLYLVLEMIEGGNLDQQIRRNGRLDLEAAIILISALADVIDHCHQRGIVHRDIKPQNVVLRGGVLTDPVVIDFGLSFNSEDDGADLTRVGEEVGNRFLRLPEHVTGGRSPISDITQLAGLLLYVLTAEAPRHLRDAEGQAPHGRPSTRPILEKLTDDPTKLRRLLSIFDVAFNPIASSRFQTASQLKEVLVSVTSSSQEPSSIDALLARLDNQASINERQRVAQAGATINVFRQGLNQQLQRLASSRALEISWGSGPNEFSEDPPRGIWHFALVVPGTYPAKSPEFMVELRGSDLLVIHDDKEIWRGAHLDDQLERSVFEVLVNHFEGHNS